MRVYEAKIVYSLVSLGEEVRLDRPEKVADYLRSAFEESPMQEAFYCVYLDRKNHPIGRHLVTLGTATSTLVAPREVFCGAILASATALVVAHNHLGRIGGQVIGTKGLAELGSLSAAAETSGSRALVPMAENLYGIGTERVVAGYKVWGNAGLVGETYNVNVLGLYATAERQGLGALVKALRAEAASAGASRISISGNAIINQGIAGLTEQAAARFGLRLTRINSETIILSGPAKFP
jgi:hypothetical protein